MRYLFILILIFLLGSCQPSLYQLVRFEKVTMLEQDTLYFVYNSNRDDIALMEKYRQRKKSERYRERIEKGIDNLHQAVSEYYHFSHYEMWDIQEHAGALPDGFYTEESRIEVSAGDNGTETRLVLQVRDRNHELVAEVNQPYSGGVRYYRNLIRLLDRRLTLVRKQAEKYSNP